MNRRAFFTTIIGAPASVVAVAARNEDDEIVIEVDRIVPANSKILYIGKKEPNVLTTHFHTGQSEWE